jgi:cytochrome P450
VHRLYNPIGWLERTVARYGVRVRLGAQRFLIASPDDANEILSESHYELHRSYAGLGEAGRFWGQSVAVTYGREWIQQRRRVQVPFHTAAYTRHIPQVTRLAQERVTRWSPAEPVNVLPLLHDVCMLVSCSTVLGIPELADHPGIRGGLEATMGLLEAAHHLRVTNDTEQKKTFRSQAEAMDTALLQAIETQRNQPEPPAATSGLLAALVRAKDVQGCQLSSESIRGEMATALRAAYKNSAITLGWALLLLAQHPEIQEALAAELRMTEPTKAELLTDVLRKTMRLYPLYPTLVRHARSELHVGDLTFPAGSIFLIGVWCLHRDPQWFREPARFAPRRWQDGLAEALPRASYIPFGLGPRHCHAEGYAMMEMKILLATILTHFRVRCTSRSTVRLNVSPNGLQAKGGLTLALTRRAD